MEIYTAPILVQASLAPKESSLLTCCCYDQVHVESNDSIAVKNTLYVVCTVHGWVGEVDSGLLWMLSEPLSQMHP